MVEDERKKFSAASTPSFNSIQFPKDFLITLCFHFAPVSQCFFQYWFREVLSGLFWPQFCSSDWCLFFFVIEWFGRLLNRSGLALTRVYDIAGYTVVGWEIPLIIIGLSVFLLVIVLRTGALIIAI